MEKNEEKSGKVSKAQQKATNKYIKKSYDRIQLLVPKGEKEEIRRFANRRGESVNALFNRLLAEAMQKDGLSYDWPPKTEKE